mmetsp:Transcript_43436/g.106654  ORF Transcript_43436/g.106654 Transcript_43436/m.106654 type:complete len:300 (+) Transcript_43436:92-991(+)
MDRRPARQTQPDELGFWGWWSGVPVVTRHVMAIFVFLMLGTWARLVGPRVFLLDWSEVIGKMHLWRPVFSGLHPGSVSSGAVMTIYFFYVFGSQLERNQFLGVAADFIWMLVVCWAFLMVISVFVPFAIWGRALAMAAIQVWAQHNKTTPMRLFLITVPGVYVPLAMLAWEWIGGNGEFPIQSICGVVAGHLYYFLTATLPQLPGREGTVLIKTPAFLYQWCESLGTGRGPVGPSSATQSQQGQSVRPPRPGVTIRNGQIVDNSQTAGNPLSSGLSSVRNRMSGGGGYNWGSGQKLGES